jgi:hypothetical protein
VIAALVTDRLPAAAFHSPELRAVSTRSATSNTPNSGWPVCPAVSAPDVPIATATPLTSGAPARSQSLSAVRFASLPVVAV